MIRCSDPGQRGGASVEMMLVVPILAIVLLAALHFASVIVIRHRVTDAANYAVRAAAIERTPTKQQVENLFTRRYDAGGSGCSGITLTSTLSDDGTGSATLEVRVRCDLPPPMGSALLGAIGPPFVSVTAAMPY